MIKIECKFCGYKEGWSGAKVLKQGTRVKIKKDFWHEKTEPPVCELEECMNGYYRGKRLQYGLRAMDGKWIGDYWDDEFEVINND